MPSKKRHIYLEKSLKKQKQEKSQGKHYWSQYREDRDVIRKISNDPFISMLFFDFS